MQAAPLIPIVPDNAPFSTEQRAWLNGFLAGLYSRQQVAPAAPSTPKTPVTILFGSQSGTSEMLAKKLSKELAASSFQPTTFSMADYLVEKLGSEHRLLLITSTYGDGEPPDNARDFFDALHRSDVSPLPNLQFSVLGLGDSKYPDFNKCARQFEARLLALGAQAVAPSLFCDIEYETDYSKWKSSVISALTPADSEPSPVVITSPEKAGDTESPIYGKHNPFPATIVVNKLLTHPDSSKETRHVEFDLQGSSLTYEAGDALAILPHNNSESVATILALLTEDGSRIVRTAKDPSISLKQCLLSQLDIGFITPAFLTAYARVASSTALDSLLTQPADKLRAFLYGKQLVDILKEFPLKDGCIDALVEILKPIQPRLYSISSSPKAHPQCVHLTMGIVRHALPQGVREGICTGYIAHQEPNTQVSVYIHHNPAFKLPSNPSTPLIMVGPGTGIAPFRGFLQERAATGASGKNWLFFGERTSTHEYLYRTELETWFSSGILNRLSIAFSRDQVEKIYVQDRMIEHGAELFCWLEEGAALYVCGDASRMAKDVDTALHKIIADHSGKGPAFATEYVKRMRTDRRYLRDVY